MADLKDFGIVKSWYDSYKKVLGEAEHDDEKKKKDEKKPKVEVLPKEDGEEQKEEPKEIEEEVEKQEKQETKQQESKNYSFKQEITKKENPKENPNNFGLGLLNNPSKLLGNQQETNIDDQKSELEELKKKLQIK